MKISIDKKKNKKTVFIIFGICVIFSIIAIVGPILFIIHINQWSNKVDYKSNKFELQSIANFVLNEYPDVDYVDLSVTARNNNGKRSIVLYDYVQKKHLDIPNDLQGILLKITNEVFKFKDAPLRCISVYNDSVYFTTFNGNYSLVYSPNNKPTFLNSPNENVKIKIKPIEDGWYHVVKKIS